MNIQTDLGEFNQCQTQLHQLYTDVLGGKGGNIIEFFAYRILYLLFASSTTGLFSHLLFLFLFLFLFVFLSFFLVPLTNPFFLQS